MKAILASAVVALLPTAVMAQEANTTADGFVSIAAGYNSVEDGDYSFQNTYGSNSGNSNAKADGPEFELRATGAVPIRGALAAQLDGVFSRTYSKINDCGGCSTYHSDDSTVAVHIFVRNPNKGLIGAVVQRSTTSVNGSGGQTTYLFGGEGKLYMGRVSFGGQMAYGTVEGGSSYSNHGPFATMKLRYFPSDNFMLEVRGEHAQLRQAPGADDGYNCPDYCYTEKNTMWDFGGKAEYRLNNSRLSLFAEADYRNLDNRNHYVNFPSYYSRSEQKSSNLRAMVGLKLNFGPKSLFERDRAGAGLDPVRPFSTSSFSFEE